ncbi:MAG: ornithine cyclodeaminase family protein [Oliverpabstia sp.]
MGTLLLTKKEIARLLSPDDCLQSAKEAYQAYSGGQMIQPPIVSFDISRYNGELDIKSGYNTSDETIGIKIASGYPDNPEKYQLDSMYALMVLLDAHTSYPLCILDAGMITYYRTAAAGAYAASLLAHPGSEIMAVIGTGGLARMHLRMTSHVFPLKTVYVYGNVPEERASYISELSVEFPHLSFINCQSAEEAVKNADIIATATPSREAIIYRQWLKAGVHINAFGCDTQGKQELDPQILANAQVYVDSKAECMKRGECQHALRQNLMTESDIAGEIGQLALGQIGGRSNSSGITVFDAVGLSVQDISIASRLYACAKRDNVGTEITFA